MQDQYQLFFQGCKFSGNCLNSGLHEAQIPVLYLFLDRCGNF